jgi:hypothetical protein
VELGRRDRVRLRVRAAAARARAEGLAAVTALALLLLAQVEPHPPRAAPLATIHVVTPLAAADAAALQKWWDGHAKELGAGARVDSVASIGAAQLLPDTLLFAWEAGFLEELGGDGALRAEAADVAASVHPVAVESWTLAWTPKLEDDLPELDSYRALLDETLRRHLRLRRITNEGPEGLVLSEIRARLHVDLERMLLSTDAAGTVLASDLPIDELLRTLPERSVTLAPVRAVVMARRAGLSIGYGVAREGLIGLTLAAALTHGSSAASEAVLRALVSPPLRDDLARTLELEPVGAADATFPEWIRVTSPNRVANAIKRERAGVERLRLVLFQAGGSPEGAHADGDWLEDLLNGALVTAAALLAFIALRAVRRAPR